jgi:regulator of replication initiation timing
MAAEDFDDLLLKSGFISQPKSATSNEKKYSQTLTGCNSAANVFVSSGSTSWSPDALIGGVTSSPYTFSYPSTFEYPTTTTAPYIFPTHNPYAFPLTAPYATHPAEDKKDAQNAKVIEQQSEIAKLKQQIETQAHNYSELQDAHDALRETLDELNAPSDDLKKAEARYQNLLDSYNSLLKLYVANSDYILQSNWDKLSLSEKLEKLDSGQNVWSVSTGKGPYRTLAGSRIECGAKESTFGVWCLDNKGRKVKHFVADLVPFKPASVAKPSKAVLALTTLVSTAIFGWLAYSVLGPVGPGVIGIAQSALMCLQLREYAK